MDYEVFIDAILSMIPMKSYSGESFRKLRHDESVTKRLTC